LAVLIATAVGVNSLIGGYEESNLQAEREATRTLAELETVHVQELEELAAEHRSKLYALWGGQPEAWAKDPELSVTQMLETVAGTAAPSGSEVFVAVEEFVILRVRVSLTKPVKLTPTARIVRAVLAAGEKYVDSVEIIGKHSKSGGDVHVVIGRELIDRVENWSAMSLDDTKALLRETRWFGKKRRAR